MERIGPPSTGVQIGWSTGGVAIPAESESLARRLVEPCPNRGAAWGTAAAPSTATIASEKSERDLHGCRDDDFLAVLAHELRHPLQPILTATAFLARCHPDGPETTAIAMIARQIGHLARLVDDLRDVSRIAHGKASLRTAPLSLGEVVEAAVDASRLLAQSNRQRLVYIGPKDPVLVAADADRLSQVFNNLLQNGVKFGTPDGLLEVIVRDSNTGFATVSVRNDGAGIPAEMLESVFDLYTQASGNAPSECAGLGIGLTVVRSLVEAHGGRVRAISEGVGKGATLIVTLPTLPDGTPVIL